MAPTLLNVNFQIEIRHVMDTEHGSLMNIDEHIYIRVESS